MHLSFRRWLLAAIPILFCGLALPGPSPAVAQTPPVDQCPTLDPCAGSDRPPRVSIIPSSGSYTSSSLPVIIDWADDGGLNGSTRRVWLNSVDVTSLLSYDLGPYGSRTARSQGTLTLSPGNNTLLAEIRDNLGQYSGPYSATYTYTAPPAPVQYAKPAVHLTPHHNGYRNVAQGSATLSYTTPAYVSLDQPRALTFLYSSAQVQPMRFVQVDVLDNSTTAPTRMSIRVKDEFGTWMTFPNGSQELFYHAGSGWNRLAAQFDEPRKDSRAYGYDVVVTTYWANGRTEVTQVPARIPVVNERNSAFGMGWSLVGLQRLYDQTTGVYVTQGDGTGLYFPKNSSGAYEAPEGDFTTMTWTGSGWKRRSPDGTEAVFLTNGLLSYVEDRFGNRTTYSYNASGRLTTITDPIGKQITLGYTSGGVLDWVQDPTGRRVTTATNGSIVWRFHDPGGVRDLDMHYDGDRLLGYWERGVDRTTGDHARWHYDYDAHGQLAAITAPRVTTTDAGQTRPVTRFKSLEAAVLPAAGTGSSTTPAARIIPGTERVEVTDPRGYVARMQVDRFREPRRIEEPLGRVTVITRNPKGQVEAVYEPTGATTTYRWNQSNLEQVQETATGKNVTIEYETAYNQPWKVFNGGSVVVHGYGTKGELLRTIVGVDTTKYTYDSKYRVKSVEDPEKHKTEYTYETGGAQNTQVVTSRTASNTVRTVTYTYDVQGREVKRKSSAGDSTRMAYDVLNRVTSSVDPRNATTTYHYQGNHLWQVRDALNKAYTYNYNALGWLESEVDPNSRTRSFRYDRSGNQTGFTNRRNQAVSFTHDELGRVLTRGADGATTTYAYDNVNWLWVAASNAESTDTIRYDRRGRVTSEKKRLHASPAIDFEVVSNYLKEGPRDQVTVTGPGIHTTVRYGYNGKMQLAHVVNLNGDTTKLEYNADGQPTAIRVRGTLTNSVHQTVGYTPSHMPSQMRWSAGAVDTRAGVIFGYDQLDRVTSRSNVYGDSVRQFGYDQKGQLTSHTDYRVTEELYCPTQNYSDCYWRSVNQLLGQKSYTYDAVGNRTDSGAALQATSNRYSTFDGFTLTYDADGNLTRRSKGSTWDQQYQWNSLGQLTGVYTLGVGWVYYGYNGFGQRVRRTDPGGAKFYYVYDGDNLAMEVTANGTRIREFAYYPGIDRPLSMRQWAGGELGAVYYYTTDLPGNVTGLYKAQGNGSVLTNQYRYTPWGTLEAGSSEGTINPLRYMAREIDGSTGLYYVRNRWYDPHLGRFISEDPIGLAGGINWYAYANNRPTNLRDPFGLKPCDEWNPENPPEPCPIEGVSGGGKEGEREFVIDFENEPWFPKGDQPNPGGPDHAPGSGGRQSPNSPHSSKAAQLCSREAMLDGVYDSAVNGLFYGAAYGAAVGGAYGYAGGTVAGGVVGALTHAPGGVTAVVGWLAGSYLGGISGAAIGASIGGMYGGMSLSLLWASGTVLDNYLTCQRAKLGWPTGSPKG